MKYNIQKDIVEKYPIVRDVKTVTIVFEKLLDRKLSLEDFYATAASIDMSAIMPLLSKDGFLFDGIHKEYADVTNKMFDTYIKVKSSTDPKKYNDIIKKIKAIVYEVKEHKINEGKTSKFSKEFLEFVKNAAKKSNSEIAIYLDLFNDAKGKGFIKSLSKDEKLVLGKALLLAELAGYDSRDTKEEVEKGIKKILSAFPELNDTYEEIQWLDDKNEFNEDAYTKLCTSVEDDGLFYPDAEEVYLNDNAFGDLNESKVNEESSANTEWLKLIWNSEDIIIAVLVAKDKKDLSIPKGELADLLQKELKKQVDPSDFNTEVISREDFTEEYDNSKNPNRISFSSLTKIKVGGEDKVNETINPNKQMYSAVDYTEQLSRYKFSNGSAFKYAVTGKPFVLYNKKGKGVLQLEIEGTKPNETINLCEIGGKNCLKTWNVRELEARSSRESLPSATLAKDLEEVISEYFKTLNEGQHMQDNNDTDYSVLLHKKLKTAGDVIKLWGSMIKQSFGPKKMILTFKSFDTSELDDEGKAAIEAILKGYDLVSKYL